MSLLITREGYPEMLTRIEVDKACYIFPLQDVRKADQNSSIPTVL